MERIDEIRQLIDGEKLSFSQASKKLNMSKSTIYNTYNKYRKNKKTIDDTPNELPAEELPVMADNNQSIDNPTQRTKLEFDLDPPPQPKSKVKHNTSVKLLTDTDEQFMNNLFVLKTPKREKKYTQKTTIENNEKETVEKEQTIEMIIRYHDVFGKQFKPNPSFLTFEVMEKKSLSSLKNYLIKYQDRINGNSFNDKLTEYSLLGIQVYENSVTSISRGKINLNKPNRVSDLLRNNPDYDIIIKEIYCQYFPSMKIKNPLLKLGSMLVLSSAVVNEQNKQSQNNNIEEINKKIDELPVMIDNNRLDIKTDTIVEPPKREKTNQNELSQDDKEKQHKEEEFIKKFQEGLIK